MKVECHNAYAAGKKAFEENKVRICPIYLVGSSTTVDVEVMKHWYRGWDEMNLAEPVDVVEDSQDVKDLDELIARLEVLRREHGNLPVNVSVFQETEGNPYGSFYEDRTISNYVSVQEADGVEFVELCV